MLSRAALLSALNRLCEAEHYFAIDPFDDRDRPLPARPDDARYFRILGNCVAAEFDALTGGDPLAHDAAWDAWTGSEEA